MMNHKLEYKIPECPEELPLEEPAEMTGLLTQCLTEDNGSLFLDLLSDMALMRQAAQSALQQEKPDLEPPDATAPAVPDRLLRDFLNALGNLKETLPRDLTAELQKKLTVRTNLSSEPPMDTNKHE